jgi:hypothetical protein
LLLLPTSTLAHRAHATAPLEDVANAEVAAHTEAKGVASAAADARRGQRRCNRLALQLLLVLLAVGSADKGQRVHGVGQQRGQLRVQAGQDALLLLLRRRLHCRQAGQQNTQLLVRSAEFG